MERISSNKSHGGYQEVYQHASSVLNCSMRFGIYLPPQTRAESCPVLYFLSGLTCTEQNAITKAGAQAHCAKNGLILVCPDTSPRGENVPDDPTDGLGQGAGFYLNALQPPWSRHYRMYDYVVDELPALLKQHFATSERAGITGHSMGGHGALTLALKNPNRYQSVSAFAPIASPTQCAWGTRAFEAYLGPEHDLWRGHDATALVQRQSLPLPKILIDQGTADPFLKEELRPQLFAAACEEARQPCELRMQPDYDHSYYFVSTFIGDHVALHSANLWS